MLESLKQLPSPPNQARRLNSGYFAVTHPGQSANLVDSMKIDTIPRKNDLAEQLGITLMTYKQAVELALERIESGNVISGWKDSFTSSGANLALTHSVNVPQHGCFKDRRMRNVTGRVEPAWQRVWSIGGDTGWYYGNWLWTLRGLLDKMAGGVGLNRGRTRVHDIEVGDALDFWRVLVADKGARRLLLFAEMRLPGEAWLEFQIVSTKDGDQLIQTAAFRPRGVSGRLYWYAVLPCHGCRDGFGGGQVATGGEQQGDEEPGGLGADRK
jgi:hypothetical protein